MIILLAAILAAGTAHASNIDPACQAVATAAQANPPADQDQQDYLLNFFSLSTTFSPLHGFMPNEPGHGAISFEASVIPPVSCYHRLVFGATKTEDTNKAPVLPRPRITFTFPMLGPIALYGGLGYVPPLTVFGTRNVIASGEAGIALPLKSGLGFGLRYHYTMLKTVADVATAFDPTAPPVLDFYSGSTYGVDAMAGYNLHIGKGDHPLALSPYVALGFTNVATFFWVGDDGVVASNHTPYQGFTGSAGTQAQWKRIQGAAEFYTAPGYVYTARFRIGVAI